MVRQVGQSEFVRVLELKQAGLVRELEQLRIRLGEVSGEIQVKEGQLRNVLDLLALEGKAPAPEALEEKNGESGRGAPFLAAVSDLMVRVDRPMHYRQLAETLAKQQVYVPGRDPAANLLAHMSRDARFRRFGRGLYGLQNWSEDKVQAAAPKKARRKRRRRA